MLLLERTREQVARSVAPGKTEASSLAGRGLAAVSAPFLCLVLQSTDPPAAVAVSSACLQAAGVAQCLRPLVPCLCFPVPLSLACFR